MKKFLDKTKKSITVGVAKFDEKINDKKVDECPEFEEKMQQFKEYEEAIKGFQKSASTLTQSVKNFGETLIVSSESFNKAVKDGDKCKAVAQNAKSMADTLGIYYNNASTYYIPTFVIAPINEQLEKIKEIKTFIDKRKKNQILLKQEQDKLKTAREKNQNVSKHEESTEARLQKFNKRHAQVMEEVTKLYSTRLETYQRIFSSLIFYQSELMNLTLTNINTSVPQCSFESNKGAFQSVTVQVPHASQKENK